MHTKENTGRSIITIKNSNHNTIALLKLFQQNKVRVEKMVFQQGDGPVTKESLPANHSITRVGTGYFQTKEIIESCREFQNNISQILGTV